MGFIVVIHEILVNVRASCKIGAQHRMEALNSPEHLFFYEESLIDRPYRFNPESLLLSIPY